MVEVEGEAEAEAEREMVEVKVVEASCREGAMEQALTHLGNLKQGSVGTGACSGRPLLSRRGGAESGFGVEWMLRRGRQQTWRPRGEVSGWGLGRRWWW